MIFLLRKRIIVTDLQGGSRCFSFLRASGEMSSMSAASLFSHEGSREIGANRPTTSHVAHDVLCVKCLVRNKNNITIILFYERYLLCSRFAVCVDELWVSILGP